MHIRARQRPEIRGAAAQRARRRTLQARLLGLVTLGSSLGLASLPATPVLSVGSESVSVGDIETQLAKFPPFQLESYGKTPDEIRRNFVEKVVVPEVLFSLEAEQRGVVKQDAFRARFQEIVRRALETELRQETLKQTPITQAEILKYYEENKARFNTPARLRLWRILVDREELAKEILVKAQGTDGVAAWTELARESSKDKATHLRRGDLGFVHPDGNTDSPEVRVDAALYRAAEAVKDGELVAAPVKEGDYYAVVWRRGSLPAIERTLEQEAPSITRLLERERVEQARNTLLERLRKERVRELDEAPLLSLTTQAFATPDERARPAIVNQRAADKDPRPQSGERGER